MERDDAMNRLETIKHMLGVFCISWVGHFYLLMEKLVGVKLSSEGKLLNVGATRDYGKMRYTGAVTEDQPKQRYKHSSCTIPVITG